MRPISTTAAGWAVCVLGLLIPVSAAASDADYDHEAIKYSDSQPDNVIERLQQRIADGQTRLEYSEQFGWLPAVLQELDVPESSQMLVFSKTSLQRSRISPRRPRAIYFNDDLFVGYCQHGDVVEISASDPQLGTVFYTLDQNKPETPTFTRQLDNCLICHASSAHTRGVPGHVVRSVFSNAGGYPLLASGTYRIDQTSEFVKRWGGWYVTGTHGDQKHLGNLIATEGVRPEEVDNPEGMNVTDLSDRFRTDAYLVPHSDIVALMVMEHQTAVQNRITQAGFGTRRALWDEKIWDEAFNEPNDTLRDQTVRRIRNACDPLIEYMLFSGEAQLTAPVRGTSDFTAEFVERGPRDAQGRSLREFDLQTRIFRYPCSYLIYSEAFDALPEQARDYVLRRIWEVLTRRDQTATFAHLTPDVRQAILEILRETKQNLPDYWRDSPAASAAN